VLAAIVLPRLQRSPTPTDHSIAVLPFRNQGGDPAEQYFADGMTDELIGTLARVPGLRVASHTSVFAFKNLGLDSRSIGSRLKAAALIEGSVARAGDSLQVSVQLINTADGFVLWSDRYRKKLADVFAVEDQISQAIASRLASDTGRPHALVHPTTENVEAYDLYLKGRWLWNQRGNGPEPLRRAIDYFSQAIALDSTYARAYAGLADAYSLLPAFGDEPPAAAFSKARAAVDRALALDSALAEAHTSLGIIHVFHDWDWNGAGREFARALALDSTDARTHLFRAWYHNGIGDYDSELQDLRTALRLDPTSPIINARFGSGLYYQHRYDEAADAERRAIALDSTNISAKAELSRTLTEQHRFAEALAIAPKILDLQAGYLGGGSLGYEYGRAGRRAEALATLHRLEARAKQRYITPEAFAFIALGLGDSATALDWLERGYRQRSFYLVLLNDPFYDSLHGSPRFQAIVRGVGLRIPSLTPAR
jgi:serine/threonine-protein kinase